MHGIKQNQAVLNHFTLQRICREALKALLIMLFRFEEFLMMILTYIFIVIDADQGTYWYKRNQGESGR